jgi:phenylacetate-CoA ligase
MSLVDLGIMKSIGPDKVKLENAPGCSDLKYRYFVTSYPPFIKNFLDTIALDLRRTNCT